MGFFTNKKEFNQIQQAMDKRTQQIMEAMEAMQQAMEAMQTMQKNLETTNKRLENIENQVGFISKKYAQDDLSKKRV